MRQHLGMHVYLKAKVVLTAITAINSSKLIQKYYLHIFVFSSDIVLYCRVFAVKPKDTFVAQ